MNILTQNIRTMSSREVADLCGKEHRNVCRDIDALNESYEQMGLLKVEQGYYTLQNTGNQQHRQFLLSKEQTIDLITGYRADIRIRINRRWQELEAQASQPVMPALPDFTNPAEAARAWASEFEQKQIAQEQLALAAPKVAHYDAVVERSTLLNATQVAHSIGLPSAQALNKKLEPMGVYNGNCKRGKEFRAWFIEKGLGEMKQASTGHQQPLFTTKGQAWIFEKLASSEVA